MLYLWTLSENLLYFEYAYTKIFLQQSIKIVKIFADCYVGGSTSTDTWRSNNCSHEFDFDNIYSWVPPQNIPCCLFTAPDANFRYDLVGYSAQSHGLLRRCSCQYSEPLFLQLFSFFCKFFYQIILQAYEARTSRYQPVLQHVLLERNACHSDIFLKFSYELIFQNAMLIIG